MKFLEKYPKKIRTAIFDEIKLKWTFHSTGLEGNTLTLGETKDVIAGITISGHSLVEHKEVYEHVRAIDLVSELLDQGGKISLDYLNRLNYAVMDKLTVDVMAPVGELKCQDNGCQIFVDGRLKWIQYSPVEITELLMRRWVKLFNGANVNSFDDAIKLFAQLHISFTSIHPYADGNGRMARLLSNIPVLLAGYPPIILSRENKEEYISTLSQYCRNGGIPNHVNDELVMLGEEFDKFEIFVKKESQAVYELLSKYEKQQ